MAPPTTRVVLERHLNAFERLTPDERKRLIVRVLCGLVAYDDHAEAEHGVAGSADRLVG